MPDDEHDIWPLDPWSRRRRFITPFFGDDMDEDFERMHRCMDALLRSAMSASTGQHEQPEDGRYVYGFTLRMGPDGRPVIQEFGNTRPTISSPGLSGMREPLVDVNDCGDSVAITAELPGVDKEDLNLTVNPDSVLIEAVNGEMKYHKDIILDEEVEPEKATATYKNGILDVQIPKKAHPRKSGHKVQVD